MAARPPPSFGPNQISFLWVLWVLGLIYPEARITSWFRSTTENQRVGGVPNSLHLEGLAADWDMPGQLLEEFGRTAVALGVSAIVYNDGRRSYVHVQARPLASGQTFSVVT